MEITTMTPPRVPASELLKMQNTLLTVVDQQRRYVLQRGMAPLTCPACGGKHSQVEASRLSLDDYVDGGQRTDKDYWCPTSGIQLTWHLPFIGAPFFSLTVPAAQLVAEAKRR